MTQDADLQPVVAAEYQRLADRLASVPAEAWETPSLCEGWRVREVIAHLTMPARYDEEAFMEQLRAHGFDFTKLSDEVAARDGQADPESLVADLQSERLQRWAPPDGGYHGALNHVVIHSLDVTVPLGAGRLTPDEAIWVVLDDLTAGGVHQHFGTEIAGRRLESTDLAWSWGTGPVVRGNAGDLALVLCGRRVPEGHLEGGLP
jgi:uncharacterized protein (TIGR03083 family)